MFYKKGRACSGLLKSHFSIAPPKKKIIQNLYFLVSIVFLLFFSLATIGASTEKQLRYLPSTFASTSNQTDFNIAVVGDWSCSSNAKKTADNINDKNPELVLAAGDLGYDTQSGSCWYDIIAPFVSKTTI